MSVTQEHVDLSALRPAAQRRARLISASGREKAPAGNVALIAAELAVVRCRWCNDDLEHCHESLVVHVVGEAHCMDATCTTPGELHHLVVHCDEVGCTCAVGD